MTELGGTPKNAASINSGSNGGGSNGSNGSSGKGSGNSGSEAGGSDNHESDSGGFNYAGERTPEQLAEEDRVLAERGMRCRGKYISHPRGISIWLFGSDGLPEPAGERSNFTARITAIITEVDAVDGDGSSYYEIEGHTFCRVDGVPVQLPWKTRVPIKEFPSLAWVASATLGNGVIPAGREFRDELREAIQILSIPIPQRFLHTTIGWREVDERWVYTHAGGGIDSTGNIDVAVRLPPLRRLNRYCFPKIPDEERLRESVREALKCLRIEPLEIAIPLFATVWRAPIGPSKTTVHMAAAHSSSKSLVGAIAQAYFGAEHVPDEPPVSWDDKEVGILFFRGVAGDTLTFVDDWKRNGGRKHDSEMQDRFEGVVRAQHEQLGRLRGDVHGGAHQARSPRGLLLTSGESLPAGSSVINRLIVLDLSGGIVTLLQPQKDRPETVEEGFHVRKAAEGVYVEAMAGYIRFLAKDLPGYRARVRAEARAFINRNTDDVRRSRTPEMLGDLYAGLVIALEYATEIGAITVDEQTTQIAEAERIFCQCALRQVKVQAEEDSATRFLSILGSSIRSGRVHLASKKNPDDPTRFVSPGVWGWRQDQESIAAGSLPVYKPQGTRVGYTDEELVWIEADEALAIVRSRAEAMGSPFAPTSRELGKILSIAKKLAKEDESQGCYTTRLTVQRRPIVGLLCVKASVLGIGDAEPDPPAPPTQWVPPFEIPPPPDFDDE